MSECKDSMCKLITPAYCEEFCPLKDDCEDRQMMKIPEEDSD